jgi:hypothetical protein
METQEIEVFVHVQGEKPKIAVGKPADILRDVLARIGITGAGQDGLLVFVGESDDALKEGDEVEDGDDRHEPADAGRSLEALHLDRLRHVHVHRCRRIAVEVNFGGKTKRRKFSPAATVGVVTQWARRKLRLDPAAAAEYVLQLCGTTTQPRPDVHLGELATAGKCALCFDLVKEVTPQG